MNNNSKIKIVFLMMFLIANFSFLITDLHGDTHTAVSLSAADVQVAISSASNGDTVLVPAGTATWDSGITISKGITVQGAGIGQTVIIVTGGNTATITNNTASLLRLTGFTFDGTGYEYAGYPQCINVGDAKFFRIDHIRFQNSFTAVFVNGIAEGLVDSCTYYLHETKHYYTPFPFSYQNVYYDDASGSHWNYYSEKALTPGTSNAWYIEDCYIDMDENMFRSSGILYAGNSGRVVFRYNTGFGPVDVCELYGISGWRQGRGFSWVELYKNKIDFKNFGYAFQFRGGTGVVYDNEITGSGTGYGEKFNLRNDRSCTAKDHYYFGTTLTHQADMCDGTSSCDGNTPGMSGYPCLDQIGRGPGPIGAQSSEPLYEWNNTYNGVAFHAADINQCSAETSHVQEGRDFYNDTQRPGYTPYIYPHPLRGAGPVDTSSPSAPGSVRDGTSATADLGSTASSTQLSANWTASTDNESGITNYQFSIGTTPGGTQTSGWATIGNVLSVTKTGLTLTVGTTYYFSVKAVNGQGLISPAANSDGQYVTTDGTPPGAPGTVRDGTSTTADISSTTSKTQLSANWTAATDNESTISRYDYSIGTTAGGANVLGWTSNGAALTVTKTGLMLTVGTTYYFSVKAVNGAGLTGNATNSNGQVVVSTAAPDTTAPSTPAVRDGATQGSDIASTISSTTLSANWSASTDNESGINNYQFTIGTTPGGTQTLGWTTIGNVTAVTKSGLTLSPGTTYYFSVKAVNGNSLTGSAGNSNGQFVIAISTGDTTPPSPPSAVRDGTSATADLGYTTSITELSANWDASADSESGISRYYFAIGSSPGATDITNWTDNGQLTSVTKTGLTLTANTTYYFTVKAENGVGLKSAVTNSNGVVVLPQDLSGPVFSNITAVNITATGATITWNTDEPSTSQVEYGRDMGYGRLTTEDSSLTTSHSVTLTDLLSNSEYHFRVISKDANGNESTSSDYNFTMFVDDGSDAKVFPNPFSLSNVQKITFRTSGTSGGEVRIYTMSGKLVKKLSVDTGAGINWNGTNEDGEKAARGIYVYTLISNNGDKIIGKLAIIQGR